MIIALQNLDVNFGREIKLDLQLFSIRPGEEKGRLKATYPSPTSDQNVKIDTSFNRDTAAILDYTKVVEDGVRIPLPSLLLAQKIVACGDRALGADGKRDTDLRDITTMVDQLQKAKQKLPKEIKQKFLTPDVMKKFWQMLPSDEHFLVKDWLEELGVE
ncbi:hypothetical protein DXG03_004751 [Asterophora parasitica]|uniref:Uncharacterized protein n=1 Tax=Asterophora parasitica TaxID=117018 RepID=A0A9P7KE37_9AGAR|nr:hypothetical protein DXG03_004751 [Asterophora parasitica]